MNAIAWRSASSMHQLAAGRRRLPCQRLRSSSPETGSSFNFRHRLVSLSCFWHT